MTSMLKKRIVTFLHYAQAESETLQQELCDFFALDTAEKYAVVNGNLALFKEDELQRILELPLTRPETKEAYLFDGVDISIVNSSETDQNKKGRSNSGGVSSNNNNNNNNNNG